VEKFRKVLMWKNLSQTLSLDMAHPPSHLLQSHPVNCCFEKIYSEALSSQIDCVFFNFYGMKQYKRSQKRDCIKELSFVIIQILSKSRWSSGLKLKFYPTNPGSTPTRVYHKKDQRKSL